jgi:hypothetical protein
MPSGLKRRVANVSVVLVDQHDGAAGPLSLSQEIPSAISQRLQKISLPWRTMEIQALRGRALQKAKIMRIAQNITEAVSADLDHQTLARPFKPNLPPPKKSHFSLYACKCNLTHSVSTTYRE